MADETKQSGRTKSDWSAKKTHEVTLPSGFQCTIALPNLPLLVKTGQIPNSLMETGLKAMQTGEVTKELMEQQSDFFNKLVSLTVVDPPLTESEVDEVVPYEDIEMIAGWATRQTDLDALGHHIAGLHTNEDWKHFRGLLAGSENVGGL